MAANIFGALASVEEGADTVSSGAGKACCACGEIKPKVCACSTVVRAETNVCVCVCVSVFLSLCAWTNALVLTSSMRCCHQGAFSSKQWAAKAHSRKCSACIESGAVVPACGAQQTAPSKTTETSNTARPDKLTLPDIATHLAVARGKYHQGTNLPDEAVCRLMLTTRIPNLPLNRCKEGPSAVPGAGTGLFATRDIAEGELVTLYPVDAMLIWEDASHSIESNLQIFFSKHIPPGCLPFLCCQPSPPRQRRRGRPRMVYK